MLCRDSVPSKGVGSDELCNCFLTLWFYLFYSISYILSFLSYSSHSLYCSMMICVFTRAVKERAMQKKVFVLFWLKLLCSTGMKRNCLMLHRFTPRGWFYSRSCKETVHARKQSRTIKYLYSFCMSAMEVLG